MKKILLIFIAISISGCTSGSWGKYFGIVRQQDLDAWVGMPVEALQTHSFFITVPVYKTRTDSGLEIWNYANGKDVASCFGNAYASTYGSSEYVSANSFMTCSAGRIVCNNIFYIRDKTVLEYKPSGQCYTDESVQPEARYKYLMRNQ